MSEDLLDRQQAVQSINENGFHLFTDVVAQDRLARLDEQIRAAYQREVHDGELFEGGGRISGHLNCFPGEGSRFVLDDLRSHGVLDVIRTLTPTGVDRLRVNCNVNLPGSAAQHYHIDGHYAEEFYLCTIAVIDTDLVNGALDVVPRTHRRDYKYWQYVVARASKQSTRVPMAQGDVLVRKSTLWHRGMPNRGGDLRPQLTLTFGESIAPDGDPFRINDGRISFFPNWYGTGWRSQLREKVRAKTPIVSSAYRFARSLTGRED